MKEKLKKALIHFFCFLLPLYWIMGFAAAMLQRYEPVKTNLWLSLFVEAALLALNLGAGHIMRSRGIKGWYFVVCFIAALGIAALSIVVYMNL